MEKDMQPRLLNPDYIDNVMLKNIPQPSTHGATNGYMGLGMFYYGLAYLMRARIAVCLGQGGEFVPRVLRQAQRDLSIHDKSRTIFVGKNIPGAASEDFPDIELMDKTPEDAMDLFRRDNVKIDYLHIDFEGSLDGMLFAYETYRPFMADRFIITIQHAHHSTDATKAVKEIRLKDDVELADFNFMEYRLAVVKPKVATKTVGAPHLKMAAFLKHPIAHSYIRLLKLIYTCIPILRKRIKKELV